MRMPPLDPDVADIAPSGAILTAYDHEHLVTYLRLLDAEADGADWRDVARIGLHLPRMRHDDGHPAADLPTGRTARLLEGFRVQPSRDGAEMAAGPCRCAHHLAGLAMARPDAQRSRGARVRRDPRHTVQKRRAVGKAAVGKDSSVAMTGA